MKGHFYFLKNRRFDQVVGTGRFGYASATIVVYGKNLQGMIPAIPTWNKERVCQELWKAFEVAPGKSQGKYSHPSFGKEPKQQEDDRLLMDYYTQHDFAEIKKELTFDIEIEYSLIESLDDPRSYNIEE
eukprot:GHVP01034492.1.p1 GENE.GHVP01034492.1~~GHVP01034492.1.p1  ORF type:complete len:129 (+),score=15.97 GHVP01034492.1:627-1013(+)